MRDTRRQARLGRSLRPIAVAIVMAIGAPLSVLALPSVAHASPRYNAVDLTTATGAPAAAGAPIGDFVCAVGPCGSRVLYETGANHIEMISYNLDSTTYRKSDLTALAHAPVAACATCKPNGRPSFNGVLNEVVYVTAAGHVEDLSMSGSLWKAHDLTALTGAPKAATLASGYFSDVSGPGEDRVVYATASGHVEQLARPATTTGTWKASDLTALTGAPAAASPPYGFGTNLNIALAQVVYETASGVVEQLALSKDGTWKKHSPSVLAGAPPAASGTEPVGYYFEYSAMRIVYEAASGSVIGLSSANTTSWTSYNLTTLTGAPLSDMGPRGYETGYSGPSSDTVVYKTHSGSIEQIYGTFGGGLTADNPNPAAPKAKSVPTGYDNNTFGNPETEGIVYETTGSDIELLYDL